MHDNTYKDFCQNCVLGLQWNMKLKSKVENLTNKTKQNNNKKKKNQTNKKQEMIDKLKTWIKKQSHAERGKNTKSKIKDGKTGKNE